MDPYEEKLKEFMSRNNIPGEHLSFGHSCHSVQEAALAANASADDFIKSICMIDSAGGLIVAIVKGEDRASTSRVEAALKIDRPRIATPDEILQKTGYPCGGVPAFGYSARFLIDPKVMDKQAVYTGGGSETSLVKIAPSEIKKANNGEIMKIRK